MTQEQEHYHSFLLRLWRAGNGGEPVWRASLESPHTGEHLGFANLGELFAYLEAQIEETALPSEESPGERRPEEAALGYVSDPWSGAPNAATPDGPGARPVHHSTSR